MTNGFHVKDYGQPVKRYVQTMARLATLPRQQEWEDYMAIFQQCAEGATSDEKWQMMDRMFYLY